MTQIRLLIAALVPLASLVNVAAAQTASRVIRAIDENCALCHTDNADAGSTAGAEGAPSYATMQQMAPETILQAITTGAMRIHAEGLSEDYKLAMAEFISGRKLGPLDAGDAANMPNRCDVGLQLRDPASAPSWNGWGPDATNARYQPDPGFSTADISGLTLKWAFGFPGVSSVYGQPTVAGGRVFVGVDTGYVYALDAATGCVHWSFLAESGVRNAISIGPVAGVPNRYAAYFGDIRANVYAVDAETGEMLWKTTADTHPLAVVTGAPTLYDGRLYVPVSSLRVPRGESLDVVAIAQPESAELLAFGSVRLALDDWKRAARRRGGFITGRRSGELRVRAAPMRGAFAVPFAEDLWIDVRDPSGPVSGAKVTLDAEGAVVSGTRRTGARGHARISIKPLEHAVSFVVVARAPDGRTGELKGILPVVKGASRARFERDRVVVESPIARDEAWLSVVTAYGKVAGGRVRLSPDGRGGAVGSFPFEWSASGELWAVVSSEADMRSMGLVGWPRVTEDAQGPVSTFDARDRLLLDGMPMARRLEQRRRRRVHWLSGLLASMAFGLVVALLLGRISESQRALDAHFERSGLHPSDRTRLAGGSVALRVAVAVCCVGLAYALVALFGMMRV